MRLMGAVSRRSVPTNPICPIGPMSPIRGLSLKLHSFDSVTVFQNQGKFETDYYFTDY